MAGMKYSTGTRFNFSVAAGIAEVIKIQVGFAGELGGLNVSGATFRFSYRPEGGDVASATVEHGEEDGCLYLHLPAVGSGEYQYVLEYVDSLGRNGALLSGSMTAISRAAADAISEVANAAEVRVLEVTAGSLHGGPLELRWCASSVAAKCAEDAKAAAERSEEAADLAKEFRDDVSATLKLAQAFMESFNKALRESITVVDNYLYVGGMNTGHVLKGEPGVTPHIGLDGFWYEGNNKIGDRPAFGKDGITPYITADGFWAFGDFKSDTRAEGRDGLDGTAVRMILVDSYEEIPQSGETCNGGFRYLVKNVGWSVVGDPDVTGSGEWEAWELPSHVLPSEFTHLRVPGVLNDNSVPVYLMVRTSDGQVLGVSQNAATWAVGDVVTWEFAEPVRVPHGATVQIFLRKSPEGVSGSVPFEDVLLKSLLGVGTCRLRYRGVWYAERMPYFRAFGDDVAESYDHFAWVEHDGEAGWVRVDRNNEIATSLVYGVMKYGTDVQVDNGAPVGQNAAGQASVPLASTTVAGVGKIGNAVAVNNASGVYVRFDENHNFVVPKAGINTFGVVKTSYTLTVTRGGLVGTNTDGNLMVRPASTTWYGTVILGEQYANDNPEPFMCHVGSTAEDDPKMAIAEVYGGAIQARRSGAWQGCMTWLDEQMSAHEEYFGDSAYLGLLHTAQFSQSSGSGLELLAATTELLAGVYIARDKNDARPAAVVAAATLRNVETAIIEWAGATFCEKDEAVTETKLAQTLSSYLTKSNAVSTYVSKTDFEKLSQNAMLKSEFLPCKKVTEEEYNALGDKLDENVAYLIV